MRRASRSVVLVRALACVFSSAVCVGNALAQEDGVAVASEGGEGTARADAPWYERDRLSGDWWGVRSSLYDGGVSIAGSYTAEFSSVLDGGVNQRGSFRNLLTVDAEVDLETAFGVPGGTLFVQYLSVNAESGGSLDSGDLQVYSNIENDRSLDTIFELWYEQLLWDDRIRLKLGKLDANGEFAYVDAAGDFANSSAGFSPTIFAFPSYPDPSTSVNLFGRVADGDGWCVTLGYGLYDGAAAVDGVRVGVRGPSTFFSDDLSDDYFHIWQGEVAWDELRPGSRFLRDGRVSVGGWYHSGKFERFDGDTEDGAAGFFMTGEIRVFAPDDDGESERGVYAFGQYGWADEDVTEVGQHFGLGAVWRGPTDARQNDSFGVYLSLAELSEADGAGFEDDEFVVDGYYRWELTPAVYLQPEIQYIVNPSGNPDIDDALVAGLRIGVVF